MAFGSRILIGAVINSKHIKLCQYFKYAKDIVLERVRNVMKNMTMSR